MKKTILSLLLVGMLLPAGAQIITTSTATSSGGERNHIGFFGGMTVSSNRVFENVYGNRVFPTYYQSSRLDPVVGLEYYCDFEPVEKFLLGVGAKLFYQQSRYEVAFDNGSHYVVSSKGLTGNVDLFLGFRPVDEFSAHFGISVSGSMGWGGFWVSGYRRSDLDLFLRLQYDVTEHFYLSLRGAYGVCSLLSGYRTRYYFGDAYYAVDSKYHPVVLTLGVGFSF